MTTITKIALTSQGQRQARDIRALHKTVGYLTDTSMGRVLWSLPRRDLLIVQADYPCDIRLVRGFASSASHSEVPTGWTSRQRVMASLIAVPEVAMSRIGQRSIRRPIPIEQWPAWLTRKLDGALDLNEVQVEPLGNRVGRKPDTFITVQWAGFAAVGTVADPAKLAALQLAGVGPHKAYGAGLLLVVPGGVSA